MHSGSKSSCCSYQYVDQQVAAINTWGLIAFVIVIPVMAIDSSAILEYPVSQNITILQGQVNMSCEAIGVEGLIYLINNESGEYPFIREDGFVQGDLKFMDQGKIRRNLTVFLGKEKAGKSFMIVCRAYSYTEVPMEVDSNIALLQVAGSLNKPQDLVATYHHSYLLISWTPPPTLLGTDISGYNITVNNQTYTFAKDNQVHIEYSDFPPCKSLDITISGYNGVDGQPATLPTHFVPSNPANDIHLPVNASKVVTEEDNEFIKYLLSVNVSTLDCRGQRPSDINVSASLLDEDAKNTTKYKQLTLVTSDTSDDILVSEEPIAVEKNKEYYVSVELSNPLGVFQNNTSFYLCLIPGEVNKHIASLTSCNHQEITSATGTETTSYNNSNSTESNNSVLWMKSSKALAACLIILSTVCFLRILF